MKIIKNKQATPTLLSTLFAVCAFTVFPASAALHDSDVQQKNQLNSSETEKIEVVGERSRRYFRSEMIKAEDSFYQLYNQLTTNVDFKVQCDKVKRTGSHIKNRECVPNFTKTMRSSVIAADLKEMSSISYDQELAFRIEEMQKKHRKSMATAVMNNPELKKLFISFQNKRQKLINSEQL